MKKATILLLFSLTSTLCLCQSYQDSVFTDLFKQDGMGWNAGDGTISIPLEDGRTLWMFGDSHVGQGVSGNNQLPCLHNTSNSIMVQDESDNFTTYYDESGTSVHSRQFVKLEGDTVNTYWPAGGFEFNNRVYTFWEKYDNPFGGEFLGIVVAEIGLPNIEVLSVTPLSDPSIEFGTAIITDIDSGYHYIYGKENLGGLNRRPALVARCPIGQLFSDWEFSAGNGNWTNDFSDSVPILDNVSNAYSVFRCGTTYFLLTQERGFVGCEQGKDIYLYNANNPEGPFENKTLAYTITDQFDGNSLRTYNAQAHPQFTQNGELLVSYNVNKTCPHSCDTMFFTQTYDADLYRPKFARVPIDTDCTVVSTNLLDSNTSINIYPNPTHRLLSVEYDDRRTTKDKIEIYTILGLHIRTELFPIPS